MKYIYMILLKLTAYVSLMALGALPLSNRVHAKEVKVLRWKKLRTYPHDPSAFTQGLAWWEPGILAESTGRYGQSKLRRVEISSGKVVSEVALDKKYFGEGLTIFNKELVQLTWHEGTALVWQWHGKKGFQQVEGRTLHYSGEGWGLTSNQKSLFFSDGTPQLKELDPKTFKVLRTIAVTAGKKPQTNLNELEWVNGRIFANMWQSTMVVRIDPQNGEVDGILDFHELLPKGIDKSDMESVLNGIAWDPKKKIFYITGKQWPSLYEVQLEE